VAGFYYMFPLLSQGNDADIGRLLRVYERAELVGSFGVTRCSETLGVDLDAVSTIRSANSAAADDDDDQDSGTVSIGASYLLRRSTHEHYFAGNSSQHEGSEIGIDGNSEAAVESVTDGVANELCGQGMIDSPRSRADDQADQATYDSARTSVLVLGKAVEQYDVATNQVVRRYLSGKEAAEKMGISSTVVSHTCQGRRPLSSRSVYGWRFYQGSLAQLVADEVSYVAVDELKERNDRVRRKRRRVEAASYGVNQLDMVRLDDVVR